MCILKNADVALATQANPEALVHKLIDFLWEKEIGEENKPSRENKTEN